MIEEKKPEEETTPPSSEGEIPTMPEKPKGENIADASIEDDATEEISPGGDTPATE